MINKETKSVLAPLYEEMGPNNFVNLLTKLNQKTKPLAPTGGMLLDDMGLGKSACVIALMLCNPPPLIEYPYKTNERVDDDDDDEDDDDNNNNDNNIENRSPTLIICPLSVISAWETQFKIHIKKKNKLRVFTYHGASRSKSNRELLSYDVVITNYDSLASDFKSLTDDKKRKKVGANLMSISWFRVVLDESHTIRNLNTIVTKSILQLKTKNKWALTGTVMPNSVKDLEAPFLFLGVHPFFEEKKIIPSSSSSSSSSSSALSASETLKESNGLFQRFIVRELKGIISSLSLSLSSLSL
jgi:SWI/SNF-related matrix-associated actin-dependent regulator of chromatin subfamily A3